MSDQSLPYVIHSDEECERLELQARLANIEGHLRHLPIAGAHRVLDVGCGSGSMSRLIARSFPEVEVVGVDVREQYLDYARSRAREEGLHNLTFERGDVFALPFPDASFDLVWSKYLLQWLREPKTALAEFKRVAKPGGHVVSCDYVGCVVEHFPIDPELERKIREIMALFVERQYRPQGAGLYDGARLSRRAGRHRDGHVVHGDWPDRCRPAAKFGDPISGHAAASGQDLGIGSERYSAGRSVPRPLRRSGDVQLHQLAFHPRPGVKHRPSVRH